MLTVVVGPPAAGKSTWVLARAKPGDIVIDFDRLAVALTGAGGDPHDHAGAVAAVARAARRAAIDTALARCTDVDTYLIHTSPGAARMAEYQQMGAHVVTLDPGRDVVRQRVRAERPQRTYAAIEKWYAQHLEVTAPSDASSPLALNSSRDWGV